MKIIIVTVIIFSYSYGYSSLSNADSTALFDVNHVRVNAALEFTRQNFVRNLTLIYEASVVVVVVINVTLPDEKQNYVHRIGRVGRAERLAPFFNDTSWPLGLIFVLETHTETRVNCCA